MRPPGEPQDRVTPARPGAVAAMGTPLPVVGFRHRLTHPVLFLEVLCSPSTPGIDLRHVRDAGRPDMELQPLEPIALGVWAETTSQGAFRPNRSAPTLRSGWRCHAATDADLHEALEQIYPGALADWHAWESGTASATSFREFVGRQSGMYRVTQDLLDAGADAAAGAGCSRELCLRRRCWNTPGLGPEPIAETDGHGLAIPCLEPCALLLDLARWMAKEQETPPTELQLTPGELESLEKAVQIALAHPPEELREGSVRHSANPRRLLLLAARLRGLASGGKEAKRNKGT
ncbi:MAG: DR2241 family protein [Limisphaerales bacterium]